MNIKPCFSLINNFLTGKGRVFVLISVLLSLSGCYSTVKYYKRAEQFVGNEVEVAQHKFYQCDGVNKDKNYCKEYPLTNPHPGMGDGTVQVETKGIAAAKEISPTMETMPWAATEEVAPPPLPVADQPLPEEIAAEQKKKADEAKKAEDAKKAAAKKSKSKKKTSKKKPVKKAASKKASAKKAAPKKEEPKKEEPKKEEPAAVDPGAPQQLIPTAKEIEATP